MIAMSTYFFRLKALTSRPLTDFFSLGSEEPLEGEVGCAFVGDVWIL